MDVQTLQLPRRTPAASPLAVHLVRLWRLVVLLAAGYWLGGLLFYSSVVIHTAHRVLGSHREVGFVTQRVTNWINVIAAAALPVLLVNLLAFRRGFRSGPMRGTFTGTRGPYLVLLGTWVLLAASQAGLVAMHPALDRLLDPRAGAILHRGQFYPLHRVYLMVTTAQLFAGLLHIWAIVAAWDVADRSAGRSAPTPAES